jgi:rod shape determining protein RodA
MRGLELPKASVGVSRWRRFRARFDWPLFIAVALVTAVGMFNLYSATHSTPHSTKFDNQLRWVVLGGACYFIFTFLDYRALVRVAWLGLGITIFLLALVHLLGDATEVKGSHRWLGYGGVRMQPSELAKLTVILALARMFQDSDVSSYTLREVVPRMFALALPVFLIAAQPDLGSSILVALIMLTIGYLALNNVWPVVGVTIAGLAAIPILWENMHGYQKQRVLAFLDPSSDPTGSGWHTRQSIFAVGSGRTSGKGFMEGTQNQFDFLPEHWTDFPFSVWAEEWGFMGALVLIALFAFLIFWTVNVALVARDRCGSVICIGAGAMLFWHLLVNIAMVLGMAPVVGVTLPFISYGGSSLVTFFVAVGMVSSVSLRRHGF